MRDPEKRREACRSYYERHREERLAYGREYYARKREAILSSQKAKRAAEAQSTEDQARAQRLAEIRARNGAKMRGDGDRMRRAWTEAECQLMRELYPELRAKDVAERLGRGVSQVHAKAKAMGLRKSDAFNASEWSGRAGNGRTIANSEAHRWKPGLLSWNKGKHYRPGGRAVEHQFKPGAMPHNWKPVGTEIVHETGYLTRKVRDDAPRGRSYKNWRFVHILLWEEANGPLPAGHAVGFRNGDKTDLRLDNLELVSRKELMRRNSIHTLLPPELVQVVQLNGALKRKINRRAEREEQT